MTSDSDPQPDFLILGAPKCGTTSVYHYLRQHPEIYLCPKETHYFICNDPGYDSVQTRTWKDYSALFRAARPEQVRGEVAVRYLYSSSAMEEIRERLPCIRLIVCLREPVDRTFSHYLMRFRTGGMTAGDGAVLPTEADVARFFGNLNHDIVQWSLYGRYLRPWYEQFSEKQFAVILLDELQHDPAGTMRQLFRFLGVDSDVSVNTSYRYNVSQSADFNPLIVRLKRIQLLRRLRNSRVLRSAARRLVPRSVRDRMIWRPGKPGDHVCDKVKMPGSVRQRLLDFFAADRDELTKLISRELTEWPKAQTSQDVRS